MVFVYVNIATKKKLNYTAHQGSPTTHHRQLVDTSARSNREQRLLMTKHAKL
jgi:hypothetical protein